MDYSRYEIAISEGSLRCPLSHLSFSLCTSECLDCDYYLDFIEGVDL